MAEVAGGLGTEAARATKPRWWRRWPEWVGYAAAAWSLIYGGLGLYWALSGTGFPLGSENDPRATLSVFGGARAETGASLVAAVLLWTRHGLAGAWLLAAAMVGSLVFGLLYHFVVPGTDNVFAQPPGPWRATFVVTAALLVPLQAIGIAVGLWAAQKSARPSTTGSGKHHAGGLAGS